MVSHEWINDLINELESLGYRINGHTYAAYFVDFVIGEKICVVRKVPECGLCYEGPM
jgi:hypothetical protein